MCFRASDVAGASFGITGDRIMERVSVTERVFQRRISSLNSRLSACSVTSIQAVGYSILFHQRTLRFEIT